MIIIADANIPFLVDAVRKEWPDVEIIPMEPEKINAASIRDADVLLVRTRTRVDEALLNGSRVRLVCTATIGYDHIDTAYCASHGIRWTSCPGCNAQAVCNYIEEAIDEFFPLKFQNQELTVPTIGIIGVGHVGSLVAKMAKRKGYAILLNDPDKGFTDSLDEIAKKCDIITFHVPLEETTFHMCDETFLRQCKPDVLVINAARGGVADEQALLRSGHAYILDTWENEPNINKEVLQHALRASMHIAGYSMEGKRNAAQMCLDAISAYSGLPRIDIHSLPVNDCHGDASPGWLARVSALLKANPEQFEKLRKAYPLR